MPLIRTVSSRRAGRTGNAIRRDFGVGPDEMLIGTVGRFSPGKGHEELLEAARILAARGLQFKLLVAGEASHGEREYEQRIRALARTLGWNGSSGSPGSAATFQKS